MIEPQIHTRIESVTARVFPNQKPNNADLPCLVYAVQDSEPQRTLQGTGSLTKHTISIEAWADSLNECNALLANVRTQLDGYQGGQIHRAFCTDPGQGEEEEDGFHKTATYTVWTVNANIEPSTDATAVIRTGNEFIELEACERVVRLDCGGLSLDGDEVGGTPDLSDYARTDQPNTFAEDQTVNGELVASSFAGNGSGLTSLNATELSSGTVADARLSTNVPLKNAANTFTQAQTVTGQVTCGTLSSTPQAAALSANDIRVETVQTRHLPNGAAVRFVDPTNSVTMPLATYSSGRYALGSGNTSAGLLNGRVEFRGSQIFIDSISPVFFAENDSGNNNMLQLKHGSQSGSNDTFRLETAKVANTTDRPHLLLGGKTFQVKTGVDGSDLNANPTTFTVGQTGQLQTNQTAAHTTPGTKVARLPIYDISGTLIGYIPIMDA